MIKELLFGILVVLVLIFSLTQISEHRKLIKECRELCESEKSILNKVFYENKTCECCYVDWIKGEKTCGILRKLNHSL